MSDRAAHRLRGHPGKSLLFGKLTGDFTVGRGLPIGNLQKDFPYGLAEFGTGGVQRRQKIRLFTGEIDIQPASGLCESGRFLLDAFAGQIPRKAFLSVEPQPGQPNFIRGQQNAPNGES